MAMIPKPYDVGADVTRLERIRPMQQALSIALRRAASAEGNPLDPFPSRYPGIMRRLSLKAPKSIAKPKIERPAMPRMPRA